MYEQDDGHYADICRRIWTDGMLLYVYRELSADKVIGLLHRSNIDIVDGQRDVIVMDTLDQTTYIAVISP